MYKYCSWTWWPPKKKKKVNTRLCSTTHGRAGVDLFFWRPPRPRAVFIHGGLQKKKKKKSTPDFPWVVLHNRGFTVLLKIFSSLAVNFFQL